MILRTQRGTGYSVSINTITVKNKSQWKLIWTCTPLLMNGKDSKWIIRHKHKRQTHMAPPVHQANFPISTVAHNYFHLRQDHTPFHTFINKEANLRSTDLRICNIDVNLK